MSLDNLIQLVEQLGVGGALRHRDPPDGFEITIPKDSHQFFLDIDTEASKIRMEMSIRLCEQFGYPIKILRSVPSKSGEPHMHVYLEFPDVLTVMERIALQACFGSDLTKELISILRYINGIDDPTLMFERKV